MRKTPIPLGEENWQMGALSPHPVGCFWRGHGLYQAQLTIFWQHGAVSLAPDEWERCRREATRIEAVDGGRCLYAIPDVERAAQAGRWAHTANGRRWFIPLSPDVIEDYGYLKTYYARQARRKAR